MASSTFPCLRMFATAQAHATIAAACFLTTLKERSQAADRVCETQRYQIFFVAVPHQCRWCWSVPGDVAEALVPSVHPTAYSALQAYPGLQSCILVSATLVYGHGQVDNHLKA